MAFCSVNPFLQPGEDPPSSHPAAGALMPGEQDSPCAMRTQSSQLIAINLGKTHP